MDDMENLQKIFRLYEARYQKAESMGVKEGSKYYPAMKEIECRYITLYFVLEMLRSITEKCYEQGFKKYCYEFFQMIAKQIVLYEEIINEDGKKEYIAQKVYGDNVFEKHGINRDRTGDREKTRYLCGKQGIFTRDRALIRPGSIRQLETRASTRSASFFHALGGPGRPYNGGGAAGAYCTHNGAKPLKQGHLRAKRGPLGPSRKSQQQTKRTGFAAHGHSIAETAPEGKRASRANGALIRA